jgi:hypothetical protein
MAAACYKHSNYNIKTGIAVTLKAVVHLRMVNSAKTCSVLAA